MEWSGRQMVAMMNTDTERAPKMKKIENEKLYFQLLHSPTHPISKSKFEFQQRG